MKQKDRSKGGPVSGPIRADLVEPEIIEFLWGGRIPKGMISVIAGQADQGKGLFAARVAADVSQGRDGLGNEQEPVNVLYSAAEDSHGLMTRPRLEAAGADLNKVLLWRFAIPKNGRELAQIIVEQEIGLVVMDPFASHLSNGVSRHSDNVRSVLSPLTELIEDQGTSVLIVEHVLKRVPQTSSPLGAIGGSGSGLPAASRAAYVFGKNPDDEDQRVLCPAKFNIGQWPKALAFELDVEEIGAVGDVPSLVVEDELMAFDPMRLFEKKKGDAKIGRPNDKRQAAAEWLTKYLAKAIVAGDAPVLSSKVQEDAKHYGMASKTLRRAAEDMGVVKTPPGGGRNCKWDLPDDVKEMMGLLEDEEEPDAKDDAPTEEITDDDLNQLLGGDLGGDDDAS
jgi:putative DNA primase/helicase